GKGFAVVADEVRNLASKSAEAAKSTTELIEGSILAVENGTTLANDTAKSFDVVVGNATTVSEIVSEISKASTEQANSIAQVTQGIDQISAVVQTNSATAEESAAASEELSGQAAMLKQLVGKFKLTNTSDAVALNPAPAREPVTTQHTVSAEKY
ncbi:MAG: methyl-accepting chemotaxis protein, partial [Oscillospiraceae bacterium]